MRIEFSQGDASRRWSAALERCSTTAARSLGRSGRLPGRRSPISTCSSPTGSPTSAGGAGPAGRPALHLLGRRQGQPRLSAQPGDDQRRPLLQPGQLERRRHPRPGGPPAWSFLVGRDRRRGGDGPLSATAAAARRPLHAGGQAHRRGGHGHGRLRHRRAESPTSGPSRSRGPTPPRARSCAASGRRRNWPS